MHTLTIEEFNKISLGTFRVVVTRELSHYLHSNIRDKDVVFVAVKGEVDWTVYFKVVGILPYVNVSPGWPYIDIVSSVAWDGDKTFTEAVIRNIVPCTDEVYNLYRR